MPFNDSATLDHLGVSCWQWPHLQMYAYVCVYACLVPFASAMVVVERLSNILA